ncbi:MULTISPECIES: SrfA family protein [Halomonas]|uniref:Virulence factor n=1 Tax=Halomonas citrativorans TaxID=2742612 RepID=A0ABR9FEN3_9GAMM|nr:MULTISPECIES: SrfA family protein [Halomonas]MBE0404939.1 hypothetical protein [Halomonas citrativorans]HCR96552.1 hypothetical protein [Halomonas sp.]
MTSLLLHSGKTDQYRALGETGQPVFHSALQLRKTIARRLKGKERHLAIPQRDQQGEGVDWYSGIPGDVVPWKNATEGEREDARIQLESFKKEIQAVEMPGDGQGGDHEVFARLVKWSCHFPDENHVYLVDGTPVLTFWGFIHPEADRHANPLQCLYPETEPAQAPAPISPPLAPLAAAVPSNEPTAVKPRPWWRRLWWLLPLALLLGLLLLLGLKRCSTPPLEPKVELSLPTVQTPSFAVPQLPSQGLNTWPFSIGPKNLALPNGVFGLNAGASMPAQGSSTGTPAIALSDNSLANTMPSQSNMDLALSEPLPPVSELPVNALSPSATEPPAGRANTAQSPTALPEPLNLPANTPDGTAAFLDGNWQGAGVMDSQSGQPLQVRYAFNQGEGQMFIRRGGQAGVMCSGPVTAVMQSGELQVEAQERARCEDGSNYEMPRVECHQNEGEMADCAASYDDEPFPMRLQKASE